MPISLNEWTASQLSTPIIPEEDLFALDIASSGLPLWKSNNPEVIRGNGWLMQSARSSPRGGQPFALTECFLYLFHINQSSQNRFIHIIATNPQETNVTLTSKGSLYNNQQFPLNGKGTGPSYRVAFDWLNNRSGTPSSTATLAPRTGHQIARIRLKNNAMADGRFSIKASAGVYLYTVVTSSGTVTDAINFTQGQAASGDIFSPDPNKFGREAGVAPDSIWSGTTQIDVPRAPAHVGLCFNTSRKLSNAVQEQTVPFDMFLADSTERTYANYGHEFNIRLLLKNPSNERRRIKLSFGHRVESGSLSQTYNGPMKVNGSLIQLFTKPTQPAQVLIDSIDLLPGSSELVTLDTIIPGLVTRGHELILESI